METHAQFTENIQATKPTPCERTSACKVIIQPGEDRFYVHNKDRPDLPGRYVCKACFRYYRGLPTTERRQPNQNSQNRATQSRPDIKSIRRDVNESQRQGTFL